MGGIRRRLVRTFLLAALPAAVLRAQDAAPPAAPANQAAVTATPVNAGGTIRGTVKAGTVPLPGVAITATNTLTGKKYATTTDVDGTYAMTIPRTGRYVVKAELAAFASATSEVRITAEAAAQTAPFTLELASRAAQAAAAGTRVAAGIATALARGTQSLNITGDSGLSDASTGGAAATPSLSGLGGDTSGAGTDSVAISGPGRADQRPGQPERRPDPRSRHPGPRRRTPPGWGRG